MGDWNECDIFVWRTQLRRAVRTSSAATTERASTNASNATWRSIVKTAATSRTAVGCPILRLISPLCSLLASPFLSCSAASPSRISVCFSSFPDPLTPWPPPPHWNMANNYRFKLKWLSFSCLNGALLRIALTT